MWRNEQVTLVLLEKIEKRPSATTISSVVMGQRTVRQSWKLENYWIQLYVTQSSILKLTTGNLINKMKAGRLDINSTISLKTALEKKKVVYSLNSDDANKSMDLSDVTRLPSGCAKRFSTRLIAINSWW